MRRAIILLATMAFAMLSAQTHKHLENFGEDESLVIWDNSTAPVSNEQTKDEKLKKTKFYYTSELELYVFKPEKPNGQSVVFFPGGSYRSVNFGALLPNFLKKNGITTIIVKYRLPNGGHYVATIEDAKKALRTVREKAGEWGIDPKKVFVSGSSAGGHLASWLSNSVPGEEPVGAILFYPACMRTAWFVTEIGARSMMGNDIYLTEAETLNTPAMVTHNTPPTLILASDDDTLVPTASPIAYYEALKANGVKASLHIYPSGGHGWSGKKDFKYIAWWQEAVLDWLNTFNAK
ncbi:MAG: alpha/beta hydrolase [Alistipes sp.]|nr:alpha/beta hydrolase [Candidatus Alistipes equi]